MSEINASNFKKEHGDLAPDLVGVTELTSPYFFVPPSGNTKQRPENCEPGTLRFNTDIGSLEVFRGKTIGWEQIQRRETSGNAGRGLYALGFTSGTGYLNGIDFVTIATAGNAKDFGDLTIGKGFVAAAGSKTRAVFSRAYNGNGHNVMDFVEIATQGNATDFGDATITNWSPAGCGDSTRGLFGGGAPDNNTLEFFTFPSTGNAVDFGNLYTARDMAACSNSTRGLFGGGKPGGDVNVIHYVTIQSLGDGVNFGDLSETVFGATGCSSSTRGIFAGGTNSPNFAGRNVIEYVTISTTGNTTDFGDLNFKFYRGASCTDATRAVIVQGSDDSGGANNSIDFITIATLGNGTDFGDKTSLTAEMSESGTSNIHGGLSG